MAGASIITDIEKGVGIAASDALKILTFAGKETEKIAAATPKVTAALGVLIGAAESAVVSVGAAAAAPANITLDQATLTSLKAVWPDLIAFAATLGIKL